MSTMWIKKMSVRASSYKTQITPPKKATFHVLDFMRLPPSGKTPTYEKLSKVSKYCFFLTSLDMIVRYLISAKVAGGQEKLGEKSQATQATMTLQLQG